MKVDENITLNGEEDSENDGRDGCYGTAQRYDRDTGDTTAIPNGSSRSVFLRKCIQVVIMKFNIMCAGIEIESTKWWSYTCNSS